MTALKSITDTWNIIEKHQVSGWVQIDPTTVIIPDSEFDRIFAGAANKGYIRNLLNDTKSNRRLGYRTR